MIVTKYFRDGYSRDSIPVTDTYALILAAGFSTRMGTCKATLPWHLQETLLTYQIQQWLQVGVTPVIVLGAHNATLARDCPTACQIVINPSPTGGKTQSILTGLAAMPTPWHSLAISAVDQPRPAPLYQQLVTAHLQTSALITVPTYGQRCGHPLLFHPALTPALQTIREETLGLRQIIQTDADQIHRVPWEDPIVLADLNTPEQYQHWRLAKQAPKQTP
jgi:molybdenum cofactor cytidylyltransferase